MFIVKKETNGITTWWRKRGYRQGRYEWSLKKSDAFIFRNIGGVKNAMNTTVCSSEHWVNNTFIGNVANSVTRGELVYHKSIVKIIKVNIN